MDHGAPTIEQVCVTIARLAPHVPSDATWEVQPCPS